MERLLITGATGFIGQNMIPKIIEHCPEIKIFTLNRSRDKAMGMFPFSQCEHAEGLPVDAIRRFNPDVGFHLATLTTAENRFEVIQPLIEANITYGTELLSILGDCSNFKLFVNTGSFSEYSAGDEQIHDAYLYSTTKSAFRLFVAYYARLKGFNHITVTPYSVYGGKPTIKRLMDYLIESIDADNPVPMTGGEQILDFIHVDDVSSFYLYILNHPALFIAMPNGEEFHVGTGKGASIKELASIVEKITHKKCNILWGAKPYRENDIMYAVAPLHRNRELKDRKATITIEEGLSNLLNTYKQ